jgi:UDP-GlcNAc:undecaprenyl-phosphate GlcNAc-1-phosphate transferase
MRVMVALLGAAIGTWFLTHIALRVGWIDQRAGQEHRKALRPPVALIGGAAILAAVLFTIVLSAIDSPYPMESFDEDFGGMAWPGLLGAFALGLLDDVVPRGLSARVKFAGQLFVAALVALFPGAVFADATATECVVLGGLALVAMNAVNLFDHADGLVGVLCTMAMAAGKAPLAPLFAASAAGYLPFNLVFRRRADRAERDLGNAGAPSAPFAMLGDSGSHVVGVLLATTPGAWWFLALPLLDMVRVVFKRIIQGRAFWRGDRTHLGHLLHGIGFSPVVTAILVAVLLLPPLVAVALLDGPATLMAGLLATAALYFGMLVMADHAMGDGPQRHDDYEPVQEPGSSGASVSDVFARASGVEEESSLADRILKPQGRRGSQRGGGGGLSEPSDEPGREPNSDDRLPPEDLPPEPFARPSATPDASSGPFAAPPPSETDS